MPSAYFFRPLDHAITIKVYLSSCHYAINLLQFTPINLGLPLVFYGGACRKYFETALLSSFRQLILVLLNHS